MKLFKTIIAVWLLIFFYHVVYAADLKWNVSEGAETYSIYMGSSESNMIEVQNTTETIYNIDDFNLSPGVYYFAVTASNVNGESGISNIVMYDNQPPSAPTNLRIEYID